LTLAITDRTALEKKLAELGARLLDLRSGFMSGADRAKAMAASRVEIAALRSRINGTEQRAA
jgi:hypothetical protein